jgi:hypothetical protein
MQVTGSILRFTDAAEFQRLRQPDGYSPSPHDQAEWRPIGPPAASPRIVPDQDWGKATATVLGPDQDSGSAAAGASGQGRGWGKAKATALGPDQDSGMATVAASGLDQG